MNRKQHWEQVYQTKTPNDVSWFQSRPDVSLKLIEATGVSTDNSIIDVGGGASDLWISSWMQNSPNPPC